MPVVPTPPTIDDGLLTSSELNQFRDAIRFLQNPPIAKLRQTVAQTLTTGVVTAVTFDSEIVDSDMDSTGGHSGSSSQWIARYPGWYGVAGKVSYVDAATGTRMVSLAANGTDIAGTRHFISASVADFLPPAVTEVFLAAGDYVEVFAFHTQGSNLNTEVGSAVDQSALNVWWLSR